MNQFGKALLVLDVDETLVYATQEPFPVPADFRVGPYLVHRRPYLLEFLGVCFHWYDVGFWSSASPDYVEAILAHLLPPGAQPVVTWGRERCTTRFNPETREQYYIKDLRKLERKGFRLARILVVDDTPRKAERNYGNAVYVRPYVGDPLDDELVLLSRYLTSLQAVENVRVIEKRGWRNRMG